MSSGFLKEASTCRIETLRNIDLEHVLGSKFNALEDRRDGIPPGPTGTKPLAMRCQFRFPLGFQGLAYDGLSRPFMQGWHPERPLFRRAAFGYPHTSERGGCVIKRELVG
jgi:hypothetical protein